MRDWSALTPSGSYEGELLQLRQRVSELERQLAQAQRLLALGSMAGGVAHDFNNLLTAILGYTSILREEPAAAPHVVEALDVIEKAADRASQLTSRLLRFARNGGEPQRRRVDIHQTLQEVVDLLRHGIEKSVHVDLRMEATNSLIDGDPSQIYQVFLNLSLNARDAMPHGGTLTLLTETLNEAVRISVIDTGVGIAPQIRERIFEPFFTTKPSDRGTGMGLTLVQSIVRAHGGRIEVDTDKAFGTVFTVILPLAGAADISIVDGEPVLNAPGKGTVLVVDDEEFVLQVAARMLRRLGYHVLCASSAVEAVDSYRCRAKDIDLVMIDMLMPDINGRNCFEMLREVDPELRAVLTSGYGKDSTVETLMAAGARGFLPKPYRMVELSEVISRAIDA